MKKGFLPLMVLLFVYADIVSGQTTRQPALIVMNNGDTLHGWIDYKGWERNPGVISFRYDSLSSNSTTYGVADLRYFEIASVEAYERATIKQEVPGLATPQGLVGQGAGADSLIAKTVFLRLLVKGNRISLYKWNENKECFYIRETGGDLEELVLQINSNDNTIAPIPLYKGTLKIHAVKYDLASLSPAIDNAGYDEHDLTKIVTSINGASNSVLYTTYVIHNKVHWFVGGGAGVSGLTISGDKSYLGQIAFKKTVVAPYVLLGFDYLFSNGVGPWGMRLELAYSSASYKATGTATETSLDHVTYIFQQNNFAPSAYVLYHFFNQPRLKIYCAVGVGANFASYPKNTYQETFPESRTIDNYADLSSFWLSGNLKAGVIFNRKIEAGIVGVYGNYSKEVVYSFDPHTYLFWVGYKFN
ncbi:MAG TPA: hypothetical protein VKQ52_01965 [Puia sp.]|nr:hypothetical protein [Puia sp.]